MLVAMLRRFVVVVTALAFLGGATVQAMPLSNPAGVPASPQTTAAMDDCPYMAMHESDKPAPCKTTSDCIKQMGCIGSPNLPERIGVVAAPVEYGVIAYCPTAAAHQGRSIEPEPYPPIAT